LIQTEQFPTAGFVVACDRSQSMERSGALAVLDDFLPRMLVALRTHKRVAETGILSIVAFSQTAEVLLPMTHIAQARVPSAARIRPGKTNFAPPLEEAYRQLRKMPDWATQCRRPVLFFLSDGQHNVGAAEQWQIARSRLVDRDFMLRPTIVTFGTADSDMDTLQSIASRPDLCHVFPGEPIAAVQAILDVVLQSTISLSQIARGDFKNDDLVGRILAFRYDDDDRPGDVIEWKKRRA
jgi:uncharacterized protein YegL